MHDLLKPEVPLIPQEVVHRREVLVPDAAAPKLTKIQEIPDAYLM